MTTPRAPNRTQEYEALILWTGSGNEGTRAYGTYDREYEVAVTGKPILTGSADPAFRGDPSRHNPKDLLLAALGACHMLSYLALCAIDGVQVVGYEDRVRGRLEIFDDGGGRFDNVWLEPVVTIVDPMKLRRAEHLHAAAHRRCFIANSCSVGVHLNSTVKVFAASK